MSDLRRERYGLGGGTTQRSISWGAIAAGVLLAIAIQLMLGLLGLGIGLGGIEASGAVALASIAGIWSVVVALIGLFAGAFSAARLSGVAEKTDAILHGVVTWAAATLLVVLLLGSTASAVLGGAFGAIGSSVDSLTRAAASVAGASTSDAGLPESARRDLQGLLAGNVSGDVAPASADPNATAEAEADDGAAPDPTEAIAAVTRGLADTASEEDRQAAVDAIAAAGNLSEDAARQRLAQYQQTYDAAVREARQLADGAARSVSAASFSAFVALLLGLLVGAAGGFLGRAKVVQTSRYRGD